MLTYQLKDIVETKYTVKYESWLNVEDYDEHLTKSYDEHLISKKDYQMLLFTSSTM